MNKLHGLTFIFLCCIANIQGQTPIEADFSKGMDFPLSKTKIGIYQTPLVNADWLKRDIPKLSQLESRSMRYEIAWGKADCYGYEMTTQDENGNLQYDFSPIDLFTDLVSGEYSNLVLAHSYCPSVAGRAWKRPPTDYDLFKEVNKSFARHWRDKKLQNHYLEIWNEPDFDLFFLGTVEDYLTIYEHAAKGILEGNPDAKIGGPAGAFQGFFTPLLDKCKRDDLPLDFLSGHAYGDALPQLNTMRNALNQAGRPDVELLLTEFAPYSTLNGDTFDGGKVEQAEAAMTFFDAVEKFLTFPDLTHVHWAQYIDPGVNGQTFKGGDKMGLIDGMGGYRKALFNGFKIYGMMPVDRFSLTSGKETIKGMASADPNNAGIVIWNTEEEEESISIHITHLPFNNGKAELYRVDTEHSWFETGDDGLDVLETFDIGSTEFSWTGALPGKAVVFLRFTDQSERSELNPNEFAHVIRTHHWFFDRGMFAYADFDFKTWITRLGMGNSNFGDAVTGILAQDIPQTFEVKFQIGETEPKMVDVNSTLNFRIDFQNSAGEYTSSVLFHGDIHDTNRESIITWGTRQHPDQTIKVNLASFEVDINQYAPTDWNGKALFTYQMQNTGRGTRAKVFMRSITPSGISLPNTPQQAFRVYPNPCQDLLTIEAIQPDSRLHEINLYTSSGELIRKKENIRSSSTLINLSDLPKGLYLLSIHNPEKVYTQKITKK